MKYRKLLQQAIDLHVHVGPEIIPRKFDLPTLLQSEKSKLKGIGIKNHFSATVFMARPSLKNDSPTIVDSVTLNNYVGGFNADIIYSSAQLSRWPIIVWFPTINAKQFLRDEENEIPSEWVGNIGKLVNRRADEIDQLSVLSGTGKIRKDVIKVLEAIKNTDAILATGHISWQESRELVKCAVNNYGIKRIIITHPIYQRINMPILVQKELANMGAYIEQCYSMYSIDDIPIAKIAQQIRTLGAKSCILSSDVGQTFSKNPSEALADFILLLKKEGISKKEILCMLIDNPLWLISPQENT